MKRGKTIIIAIALILILIPYLKADDVPTELNIPNNAPFLITPIPNQTWAKNTNNTNAFDLDDHFDDESFLNYTNTSVQNITVEINETTSLVSFYPDHDFTGTRNVTFTAFDGVHNTSSNLVYLNITSDTKPPTWSNLSVDIPTDKIFQNNVTTFSADWKDNIGLEKFIFSINQGTGWVNHTGTFTGKQNTSTKKITISASGGNTVSWYFTGFDAAGNSNKTDTQSFTVSKLPSPQEDDDDDDEDPSDSTDPITGAAASEQIKDFTLSPGSISIEMKQGEKRSLSIKVTNTGNSESRFTAEIVGLQPIESLVSESSFTLPAGGSKTIALEFTADKRTPPEVYFGRLMVSNFLQVQEVPMAITLKATEIEFDVTVQIPEDYKKVRQGKIVLANITLENIKDIQKRNVSFYIALNDFTGKIYDSSQESLEFSSRQVSLIRNLTVPLEASPGEYIFLTRANTEETTAIDTDTFKVIEKFSVLSFVRANLIFVFIIFLGATATIFMIRYHRNKERLKLLNLYLLANELKDLLAKNKLDEAIDVYIKIKTSYGEKVRKTTLENKEELKKEMKILAEGLEPSQEIPRQKPETKEHSEGRKEEKKKEPEKKKEEKKKEPEKKQKEDKNEKKS